MATDTAAAPAAPEADVPKPFPVTVRIIEAMVFAYG